MAWRGEEGAVSLARAVAAAGGAGVLDHELRVLANSWASAGISATGEQLAQALLGAYLVPAADTAEGALILAGAPALTGWASPPPQGFPTQARRAAAQIGRLYPDPGEGLWTAPVPDRLPDTHLLRIAEEPRTTRRPSA